MSKQTHNIYTIGLASFNDNGKAQYLANYVNDKSFDTNVLSLLDRPDFNLQCGQSGAFTHNGMAYLFTGGDDQIVYYIVCKNDYPTRVLRQCTNDLQCYYAHYKQKGGKIDQSLLKKICDRYDDPTEIDKLAALQKKVDSVKGVMQDNIDIAMKNCVKLTEIQKQSEELQQMAGIFKKDATQLKNKMWWKNIRMKIIIAVIILTILGIIIGVIVGMSQQKN